MTGLVSQRSAQGVPETVAAIRDEAERRGAAIAAVIDHAAAARAAGLVMPATQVVIFGNPRGDAAHAGQAGDRDRPTAAYARL